MPVEAVRPLVPSALDLDCHDGRAWITLIPFLIAESRPAALPRLLASAFLETNLRTYVRGPDGDAGIYFFSLEAESLLAEAEALLNEHTDSFEDCVQNAASTFWQEEPSRSGQRVAIRYD